MCEIPDALWECPRVAAFERYAEWLAGHHGDTLGLPHDREVVVEMLPVPTLPRCFGDAVGVFVVEERRPRVRGFHDELRVLVAAGAEAGESEWEWQARLETLPHELRHAGDFWQQFAATPAQVARAGELIRWRVSPEREAQVEWLGRSLTARYLDEHPQQGRQPR